MQSFLRRLENFQNNCFFSKLILRYAVYLALNFCKYRAAAPFTKDSEAGYFRFCVDKKILFRTQAMRKVGCG